jgi:hypothetical protein
MGTPAQRRQRLLELDRERPEDFSIALGCRTMKLARSTFYYRARRAPIFHPVVISDPRLIRASCASMITA